jgi:hypothetical protein
MNIIVRLGPFCIIKSHTVSVATKPARIVAKAFFGIVVETVFIEMVTETIVVVAEPIIFIQIETDFTATELTWFAFFVTHLLPGLPVIVYFILLYFPKNKAAITSIKIATLAVRTLIVDFYVKY